MSDDNTAEFTAAYVWSALSHDGEERRNLGGLWHPSWAGRFNQEAIQRDFDSLDRPGMRGRLEGPGDRPDVRYAAIIEGEESIDGELVEDRPIARWLSIKYVPELNFWALAHYGPTIVQPDDLPE